VNSVTKHIALSEPTFGGREVEYLQDAIRQGNVAGGGPYTEKVEALLKGAHQSPGVLLTTSCTHALEMAALLLDIRPGDEVIVPSFTFVSTASAFALRGARIVFADITPDTLSIDSAKLESLLTPRTRAVVPVHYAGVGCDMPRICELANARGIAVVEDNAHGLFASKAGRLLGTYGALSTLSFHATKNFVAGEGGALIVNDPDMLSRAEIIRDKGTNRRNFLRGAVDKYTWMDLGSSYAISDLLAAVLLAQLEQRDQLTARRKFVWDYFNAQLSGWSRSNQVQLPTIPVDCEPSYHLYYVLMPSHRHRDRFLSHMREFDIECAFHYVPLHSSPFGIKVADQASSCPVTTDVASRIVRIPLHASMSDSDAERVVQVAARFRCD
jgi:dTDP-4-amino-4,6-dideoxygalactose transaminase